MMKELQLLRVLKHASIIDLIDICLPKDKSNKSTIYLVTEHTTNDLRKILKSNITINMDQVKKLVYSLLCALKHLHDHRLIHGDLKPSNVIINEDFTIKLSDFGTTRKFSAKSSQSDKKIGSNVNV